MRGRLGGESYPASSTGRYFGADPSDEVIRFLVPTSMPPTLRARHQSPCRGLARKRSSPGQPALEPVISALKDFAELRVLRIVDARILAADINGSLAAVTVEHLWWDRLSGALAEAQAEMVSDLETPKVSSDRGPGPAQLHQIERLNQMRSIGTLTEAEFAQAKRDV